MTERDRHILTIQHSFDRDLNSWLDSNELATSQHGDSGEYNDMIERILDAARFIGVNPWVYLKTRQRLWNWARKFGYTWPTQKELDNAA